MAEGRSNILVIGGGSRIAAALAPLLGNRARFVARRVTGSSSEILVEDYCDIPRRLFEGVDCVVNCVGVSSGDTALMHRLNVDMPLALARRARAAGTRRIVHISSFAVYGGARLIDTRTPVAPASAYGRSKLAADTGLFALARGDFRVALLRLPLIYSQDSFGKLGQLLKLWSKVRILPVPAADVARAMISTDLSAEIIAHLLADSRDGILLAADPQPFTYKRAAAARSERLARFLLPQPMIRTAELLAPRIALRMFADSRLADADNLAIDYGLRSRLYRDIAEANLT